MNSLVADRKMTAFFEKMATRETGRLSASARETAGATLVVSPENLNYAGILDNHHPGRNRYFIEYADSGGEWLKLIRQLPFFLWRLLKILSACKNVELYLFSPRIDGPFIMAAAALARLIGRPVRLYDYRFRNDHPGRLETILQSFCSEIVYGDISGLTANENIEPGISFRIESIEAPDYNRLQKKRAVPRVLVYGDFTDEKTITLIRRTHDLVKRKYPRTEFILSTLLDMDSFESSDNSLRIKSLVSEKDMADLLDSSDIMMLISPGGGNRLFGFRAARAGYPIITNGFEFFYSLGTDPVIASRDSYSALADAVTRMVDDEEYYRGFSRPISI